MSRRRSSSLFRLVLVAVAVTFAAAACGRQQGWSRPAKHVSALGRALPVRLPATSGRNGTFWVDGRRGSDRNRGTRARPWKTIRRALASVPLSGSVIEVLPGTYESRGTDYAIMFNRHGDIRDPVTLRAAKRGTVTIVNGDLAHQTLGAWAIRASGLRISGFRFRVLTHDRSNVAAGSVLVEDSQRIEITDCIFNEVSSTGITVRGGVGRSSDDIWVIGNHFRPSGADPTAQATGLGFARDQYFGSKGSHWLYAGQYATNNTWEQTSGSRRLVIANNIFAGTAAGRDIELGPQARNSFVVDNTFYGNQSAARVGADSEARFAGQAVQFFSNTSTPAFSSGFNVVANNVFVNLHGHAVAGSGPSEPGNVVTNNVAWQIAGDDAIGSRTDAFAPSFGSSVIFSGQGNLARNPLLTDVSAYDFHPRRGSPVVGRAALQFAYPYDAAGRLRPRRPAIGALEPACAGPKGRPC